MFLNHTQGPNQKQKKNWMQYLRMEIQKHALQEDKYSKKSFNALVQQRTLDLKI